MKLMNESGSICIDVDVPGPIGRARGLLGTKTPPPMGSGILLKGRQVHTFGMRYAIDVMHLDLSGRILTMRTLSPNRLGPRPRGTRNVLELAEGEVRRMDLQEGMSLILEEGNC